MQLSHLWRLILDCLRHSSINETTYIYICSLFPFFIWPAISSRAIILRWRSGPYDWTSLFWWSELRAARVVWQVSYMLLHIRPSPSMTPSSNLEQLQLSSCSGTGFSHSTSTESSEHLQGRFYDIHARSRPCRIDIPWDSAGVCQFIC